MPPTIMQGKTLIEEGWKVATTQKLPAATELQATSRRLG